MSNTPEAPKRGRPPTRGQSASDHMHLRVSPDNKAAWRAKAEAAGKSLSTWVIDALNDKAKDAP